MSGYYPRKSFCMGEAGELVQVAGHAFELGQKKVTSRDVLGADARAHDRQLSTAGGLPCAVVRQYGPMLASVVYAPCRDGGLCGIPVSGLCSAAAVRPYVWSVAWIRLFVLDHRDESCKASFWLTKTQTCLTTFSYPACVWAQYVVGTVSPANTRSNPYAPDKDATG